MSKSYDTTVGILTRRSTERWLVALLSLRRCVARCSLLVVAWRRPSDGRGRIVLLSWVVAVGRRRRGVIVPVVLLRRWWSIAISGLALHMSVSLVPCPSHVEQSDDDGRTHTEEEGERCSILVGEEGVDRRTD